MQETWVRSLSGEDLLEEEMATHSSILAWKILQTEDKESDMTEHTLTHREKERLSNLTKVTQEISGRVRTGIQVI